MEMRAERDRHRGETTVEVVIAEREVSESRYPAKIGREFAGDAESGEINRNYGAGLRIAGDTGPVAWSNGTGIDPITEQAGRVVETAILDPEQNDGVSLRRSDHRNTNRDEQDQCYKEMIRARSHLLVGHRREKQRELTSIHGGDCDKYIFIESNGRREIEGGVHARVK